MKLIVFGSTGRTGKHVVDLALARGHQDYCPKYCGDLRARDGAYHQGTVWVWPIGPFIDACLRAAPDELGVVREMLGAFDAHLSEAGVGTISEIFDAEPPYAPRGCIAQAWSVAEVLRVWSRLVRHESAAAVHASSL